MRLLRSWPAQVPTGRNYVVDTIPRLILDDYDYAPLADVDDDVVLVEWDIAVAFDDLKTFIAEARSQPDRVIVAPYLIYVTTRRGHRLTKPLWCHRRPDGTHVEDNEPTCAYFGFGLIYFPRVLVRAFRESWTGHFSDGSFSAWHRNHVGDRVPILWNIRPTHLHYNVADLGVKTAINQPSPDYMRPLGRLPDPGADDRAADRCDDPRIAALLRERAGLVRSGRIDRLAAVDEQLAIRGYTEE